jgi:protein-S-isoprenylcysteine O-methyltransferase Ste14
MKKTLFLLFGIFCYAIFFGTYCYAIGFVTNLIVPAGLDSKPVSSVEFSLLVNAGLLLLFAIQHSIMARPAFKQWWTKIIPEPIERSVYVLLSSLCLIALFYFWQPMGGIVWSVKSDVGFILLNAISLLGFTIVLISTFLINHFDLFGLRQVWLFFIDKKYEHLPFKTPLFYKYVRHPLYLGWMIAFWSAPIMTIAHFLFAALCTGYMLTAIRFEEKDLITVFGEKYIRYRQMAPMLIPFIKRRKQ